MLVACFVLSGCCQPAHARQQYFTATSQTHFAWQQNTNASKSFYGCGNQIYPCFPQTPLQSATLIRSH